MTEKNLNKFKSTISFYEGIQEEKGYAQEELENARGPFARWRAERRLKKLDREMEETKAEIKKMMRAPYMNSRDINDLFLKDGLLHDHINDAIFIENVASSGLTLEPETLREIILTPKIDAETIKLASSMTYGQGEFETSTLLEYVHQQLNAKEPVNKDIFNALMNDIKIDPENVAIKGRIELLGSTPPFVYSTLLDGIQSENLKEILNVSLKHGLNNNEEKSKALIDAIGLKAFVNNPEVSREYVKTLLTKTPGNENMSIVKTLLNNRVININDEITKGKTTAEAIMDYNEKLGIPLTAATLKDFYSIGFDEELHEKSIPDMVHHLYINGQKNEDAKRIIQVVLNEINPKAVENALQKYLQEKHEKGMEMTMEDYMTFTSSPFNYKLSPSQFIAQYTDVKDLDIKTQAQFLKQMAKKEPEQYQNMNLEKLGFSKEIILDSAIKANLYRPAFEASRSTKIKEIKAMEEKVQKNEIKESELHDFVSKPEYIDLYNMMTTQRQESRSKLFDAVKDYAKEVAHEGKPMAPSIKKYATEHNVDLKAVMQSIKQDEDRSKKQPERNPEKRANRSGGEKNTKQNFDNKQTQKSVPSHEEEVELGDR